MRDRGNRVNEKGGPSGGRDPAFPLRKPTRVCGKFRYLATRGASIELPDLDRLAAMIEKYLGQWWATALMRLMIISVVLGVIGTCGAVFFGMFIGPIVVPFMTQVVGATQSVTTGGMQLPGAATVLVATFVFFVGIFAVLVWLAMRAVYRRVVPQSVIDQLAEYRSQGIAILNTRPANALLGPEEIEKYVAEEWAPLWDKWRLKVVSYLGEHLTLAEKLSFERLGLITEQQFKIALNPSHGHKLMMLAKQLTILEDMIQRFQERR